ncbi:MAG: NAD(P)H-dependent oxidoreductase [Candidatus Pacebacteria bacterium]|nr:NAD(P)H-dependent oxidoreductase [Candidatus Paceibacterota bacterium]
MAKYLLISGSPRKGNTDFVLSRIFESIEGEKELIFLRDKNIGHCIGCLSCHTKPQCAINDDMTEIRQKMLSADMIIIGTPNYFDNVSGLLKDFIDRTHPFYKAALLKDKKLILIMVGGGKAEGSKEFLDVVMSGFVKYLGLDLMGSYCFQALYSNDLRQNPESNKQVEEIIKTIKIASLKEGREDLNLP